MDNLLKSKTGARGIRGMGAAAGLMLLLVLLSLSVSAYAGQYEAYYDYGTAEDGRLIRRVLPAHAQVRASASGMRFVGPLRGADNTQVISGDLTVDASDNGICATGEPGLAAFTTDVWTYLDGWWTARCLLVVTDFKQDPERVELMPGESAVVTLYHSFATGMEAVEGPSSNEYYDVVPLGGTRFQITALKPTKYATGIRISAIIAGADWVAEERRSGYTELVIREPIRVSSIALSEYEMKLTPGKSRLLLAEVLPEDAQNKDVVWESSDERVARVENGMVKAVAEGFATITCTAADGGGACAACDVTVANKAIVLLHGICGAKLFNAAGEPIWPPDIAKPSTFSDSTFSQYARQDLVVGGAGSGAVDYGAQDFYKKMLHTLKSEFEGAYDVQFFQYDWRQSVDDSAERLEAFITKKGYSDVVLVAHSMGGLVSSSYLLKEENRERIDKLITLGTPYLGSPLALYVLETGDLLTHHYYKDKAARAFENFPIVMKRIANAMKTYTPAMQGVYDLLPARALVEHRPIAVRHNGWGMGVTGLSFDQTEAILKRLGEPSKISRTRATQARFFSGGAHITESVDAYYIIGYGQATLYQLEYDKNGKMTRSYQVTDGDGTVPLGSATMLKRAQLSAQNRLFCVNTEHNELMSNAASVNQVVEIIKNGMDARLCGGVTRLPVDGALRGRNTIWTRVLIECPVDVEIKVGGETIARVTDNTVITADNGRAAAFVSGDGGDIKSVFVLTQSDANVTITATDAGDMRYTLERLDAADEVVSTARYDAVAVKQGSVITTHITQGAFESLFVDVNGDGSEIIEVKSPAIPMASLSIGEGELRLGQGVRYALPIAIEPAETTDKRLSWASDRPDVATADGGTVVAVAPGYARITATALDGSGLTASRMVKVVEANAITIAYAEKYKIDYTKADKKNKVSWMSMQKKIASVNAKGRVTGKGAGETLIVATERRGKALIGTSVFPVTVTVRPRSLSLNPRKATLYLDSPKPKKYPSSMRLKPVVKPSAAADVKVTWTSGDEGVVVVADGEIRAIGIGEATVTAALDGGLSAEARVVVKAFPGGAGS